MMEMWSHNQYLDLWWDRPRFCCRINLEKYNDRSNERAYEEQDRMNREKEKGVDAKLERCLEKKRRRAEELKNVISACKGC